MKHMNFTTSKIAQHFRFENIDDILNSTPFHNQHTMEFSNSLEVLEIYAISKNRDIRLNRNHSMTFYDSTPRNYKDAKPVKEQLKKLENVIGLRIEMTLNPQLCPVIEYVPLTDEYKTLNGKISCYTLPSLYYQTSEDLMLLNSDITISKNMARELVKKLTKWAE